MNTQILHKIKDYLKGFHLHLCGGFVIPPSPTFIFKLSNLILTLPFFVPDNLLLVTPDPSGSCKD